MSPDSRNLESDNAPGQGHRAVELARKRRHAVKAILMFGLLFLGGVIVRSSAPSHPVVSAATLVAVIGFLGAAWWASVLYDARGSG